MTATSAWGCTPRLRPSEKRIEAARAARGRGPWANLSSDSSGGAASGNGVRANVEVVASGAKNSDFIVDTLFAHVDQSGDLVTIGNVTVQRGSNQIVGNASIRLRAAEKDFVKQPATIQIAITAPQTADFWNGNSQNRVSGALNASGIVQWNGAIADG